MYELKPNISPFKSYKITIETTKGDVKTIYSKELSSSCEYCQYVDWPKLQKMSCKRNQQALECNFKIHEVYSKEILSHIPLSVSHLLED